MRMCMKTINVEDASTPRNTRKAVHPGKQEGKRVQHEQAAVLEFFEQVLKSEASILGGRWVRQRGSGIGARFTLYRLLDHIKSAGILRILGRNPLLHCLAAFKPASRIKVVTHFARVQIEAAFGTFHQIRLGGWKNGSTNRASRHGTSARHV